MLHQGAQRNYIEKRVNMPTKKSHAEIVRDVDAGTKARSFWSARVVDARRLEKIREVSDAYSRGEFGLGEARNILKDYLKAEGYDPHEAGIRNLASTGRLNLILKQNAAMAHSAGEWARMHDPDAMAVFPYVRYHARNDSRTRSEHAHLNGKIFHKDDPFLRTHTPPWEFNCRCWLEEITEKAAGKTPELIQKPTPPDKVTVDSRSGFVFDPERAFEEFDLSGVKTPELRGEIREEAEIEFGDQVSFGKENTEAKFEGKQYKSFSDEGLSSAKEWTAAPSPKRIEPEAARKRLEAGFEVIAGDGRKVVMDRAVLEHWTVENNKRESDVESRLACLDYALETLREPNERWDQETQSRYLKKFQKTTGGFEGCMVVVTKDGKCRTYFLPNVTKLDKSRTGISYKVIGKVESSTGRSATQTTEAIAAPGRSDDRKTENNPETEKVKEKPEKSLKMQREEHRREFARRLEASKIAPEQKQHLLEEWPEDVEPPKRVEVVSPLTGNAGYRPGDDVLKIYHSTDAGGISHEMTHLWQHKAQQANPGLIDEIRAAQKADWERLQSRIKAEYFDFGKHRDKWAKIMFGTSSWDELTANQRRTFSRLRDAIGSVSVGQYGGNHGATREDNRKYFEYFDKTLPAQEALAQIRSECRYGFERFGEIFPNLTEILKKHRLL